MSSTIARSILRKLSACRSSLDASWRVDSLVTPSTTWATCSPNSSRTFSMRVRGVLDDVVQQAGGDGHDVEPQVGQHVRHLERMDHVGLPRSADLSLVLVGREHVGLAEQFGVGVRIGRAHLFEEVFEPDHGCRCLTGIEAEWRQAAAARLNDTGTPNLDGFFAVHYTGPALDASPDLPGVRLGGAKGSRRKEDDMQVRFTRLAVRCRRVERRRRRLWQVLHQQHPVGQGVPGRQRALSKGDYKGAVELYEKSMSLQSRTSASPTSSSATATTTCTSPRKKDDPDNVEHSARRRPRTTGWPSTSWPGRKNPKEQEVRRNAFEYLIARLRPGQAERLQQGRAGRARS